MVAKVTKIYLKTAFCGIVFDFIRDNRLFFSNFASKFIIMDENNMSVAQPGGERAVLRTEGLVKRYGARTVANGVTINVKQGEIVGQDHLVLYDYRTGGAQRGTRLHQR